MQTETTTPTGPAVKKVGTGPRRRLNAEILKLKPGEEFRGVYKGSNSGPWVDPKSGEEKTLVRLNFERGTERYQIFEDGGLRNAMSSANVVKDDEVILVKGEKTDIGNGRTCNSWEIYSPEDH